MAEVVARRLVHDIIERGLDAGESLDAEQTLMDRFAVSRESTREALRLLEVAGLVKLRRGPGGGAFVGTVDPVNLGRFASMYFHMAGATYAELFTAYTVADSILAEFAARNPSLEERRRVMAPYLAAAHDEADLDQYFQYHTNFHAAIASLAGNRVMEISFHSLGLLVARHYLALAESRHLTLADARSSRHFVESDHDEIAVAVVAGNHRKAHDLMRSHTEHVVSVMTSDGLDPNAVIEWT